MSPRPSGCQATQGPGGVRCVACGMQWDLDDADPPDCRTLTPARARGTPFVNGRYLGDPEPVAAPARTVAAPVDLSFDLADRMARAYETERGLGLNARAMRAAWRVFLDEVGT